MKEPQYGRLCRCDISVDWNFRWALGGQFVAGTWQLRRIKLEYQKNYRNKLAEQIQQSIDEILNVVCNTDMDIVDSGSISPETHLRIKKVMSAKASMTARILAFEDKLLQDNGNEISESMIRYSQLLSPAMENDRLIEMDRIIKAAGLIIKRLGAKIHD